MPNNALLFLRLRMFRKIICRVDMLNWWLIKEFRFKMLHQANRANQILKFTVTKFFINLYYILYSTEKILPLSIFYGYGAAIHWQPSDFYWFQSHCRASVDQPMYLNPPNKYCLFKIQCDDFCLFTKFKKKIAENDIFCRKK